MPTYSILSVHFNIGVVISPRISQSRIILFWCLSPSVNFYMYTIYHGLLLCNYKNIKATLPFHWFSPVMYRVFYFQVCTHISVSTNHTITIINFIYTVFHVTIHVFNISLSLSCLLAWFYLPACPSENILYGIEIISCFQQVSEYTSISKSEKE